MYEHHTESLLTFEQFIQRWLRHFGIASYIVLCSLGIGVGGYHYFENLPWIDSLLKASMILGGMGPVNTITTTSGEIFASLYSLFSGIVFLAVAGILVAPVAHRMLHSLHLAANDEDKDAVARPAAPGDQG